MSNQKIKLKSLLLVLILSFFFFTIDLLTPLGVAGGIPYILVIFVSLQTNNVRFTCYVSILCIGLIGLGYLYSPAGAENWIVLMNRLLAVFAINITTYLGVQMKEKEVEIGKIANMPSENPHPVLRISYDIEMMYCNKAAKMFFSVEQSKDKKCRFPAQWKDLLEQVIKTGKNNFIDYRAQDRVFSLHFVPVPEMRYVNIYATDVTLLKSIENQLQAVADLPAENPNPILRISYAMEILYANQPATQLFQLKQHELNAMYLPAKWKKALKKSIATTGIEFVEQKFNRQTLQFSLVPIPAMKYINIYGSDITQLKISQREMKKLAETDELTGLFNRRIFNNTIESEIRRSLRFRQEISLLMIDVDFFKKYNDTYGHLAGDSALKKIAHLLQNHFNRPGDLVSRYGGEEFSVILPATGMKGAIQLAGNVITGMKKLNITHEKSQIANHVTVSIGVASFSPHRSVKSGSLESRQGKPEIEPASFVKKSDEALYEAKRKGRNCVFPQELFTPYAKTN